MKTTKQSPVASETILIVDDSPDNLIVMKKVLEKALPAVTVLTCQHPEKAQALLRETEVALALIDVQMPKIDGLELCKRIKNDAETPFVSVMLITSHDSDPKMKAKGLTLGADDFITRPMDNAELCARVKVALRVHRVESALRDTVDQAEDKLWERKVRFRSLVENLNEAVFSVQTDGVIEYISPAITDILGYQPEEMFGKPYAVFFHPHDIPLIDVAFAKVLEGNDTVQKYRMLTRSGELRWVQISMSPMQVAADDSVYMQGVLMDITERKLVEEALSESEVRNDQLACQNRIIVWEVDVNGLFTYCSHVVENVLGYRPDEIVGKKYFYDLHPEEGREVFKKLVLEGFSRKEVFQGVENQVETKEGRIVWMLTTGIPLLDEQGELLGYRGSDADITDRKQAVDALLESEKKYRDLAENMEAILWEYDFHTDCWPYVSPQSERILGYAPEEWVNFDFWITHLHEEDREEAVSFCKMQTLAGKAHDFEYRFHKKNGDVVWLNDVVAVKMQDGQPVSLRGMITDITERKQSEELLRESESRFRYLFENAPLGHHSLDENGDILELNETWCKILGYIKEEAVGRNFGEFVCPDLLSQFAENFSKFKSQGYSKGTEFEMIRKDGSEVCVSIDGTIEHNPDGSFKQTHCVLRDVTDQKALEEQFRQAQKMDSIGRLAGGVAHDFNNMLQVILGYTDMALKETDPEATLYNDLTESRKAASRAAALTRQLLAFARKQTMTPKVIDLNETVCGMLMMLRQLIGEDIDLIWQPTAADTTVKMDPSQIDQILANLCVNARDAIAGVGKLKVETGTLTADAALCAMNTDFVPGEYVTLSVSDTGCGMDPKMLKYIFEPFYTTKGVGEGTGLGLSTVYGIVKQNKGNINLTSVPGKGTTFRLCLPRHLGEAVQLPASGPAKAALRGHDTVLLVEDEPLILEMGKRMLESLGYRVLTADLPDEAIAMAEKHTGEIHLLLTDVVMPRMNGQDLAARLTLILPGLKHMFMSGYTADIIAKQGLVEEGVHFIQKPFTIQDLAAKVRDVLRG